jgi:hypothetical protein
MRLFAGFVVQPFAAAVLGFTVFPLIELSGRAINGGASADPMGAAISIGLGAGVAAFFVTVGGAFPAVVWFLKRGPLTLKHILWGGVVLGNLPFAVIVPPAAMTRHAEAGATGFGPLAAMRALAAGAIFGLAGAALFWVISIRGTEMERPSAPRNGC